MAELDWRSIFQRYADHVGNEEGTDFISGYLNGDVPTGPRDDAGPMFTDDELIAIRSALGVKRRFRQAVAGFLNLETVDGRIIRELDIGSRARCPVGQDGLTIYNASVDDGVLTIGGTIDNGRSGYPSIGLDQMVMTVDEATVAAMPARSPLVEMTGRLAYVTLTDKPCWPGLTYLEGFPA
jgi:hypothetical protein